MCVALARGVAHRDIKPTRRNITIGAVVAGIVVIALLALGKRPTPVAGGGSTDTTSIAVLPFADLSADHSNAYLGDGIAETLINALVNVPGLDDAALTARFRALMPKMGW